MVLDNDTRGWIMTGLSGAACTIGAVFVCVDILVRLFPGQQSFHIQDSDSFLGASLSLSAGVMMFSSLYSMLPSAKSSLMEGGYDAQAASWIMITLFLAGAAGIQFFSVIIHRFMPSHAVDCDHSHAGDADDKPGHAHASHGHTHHGHSSANQSDEDQAPADENTPLLAHSISSPEDPTAREMTELAESGPRQKPTLQSRVTATMDPCGQDCFKNVALRGGVRRSFFDFKKPQLRSSTTAPASVDRLGDDSGEHRHVRPLVSGDAPTQDESHTQDPEGQQQESPHHHHIPTNAFLSISLQTSIAIALHKLPEGFITYATNHANPKLGVAVFLAIAVHNLTEGFALALPIFLASGSRLRAIVISVVLGGLTQPLGAGIAAAWLQLAERDRGADASKGLNDAVYGGMFAVTAGIMSSVALSLIHQSMELSHARGICMAFAFVGMGILGMSTALTA